LQSGAGDYRRRYIGAHPNALNKGQFWVECNFPKTTADWNQEDGDRVARWTCKLALWPEKHLQPSEWVRWKQPHSRKTRPPNSAIFQSAPKSVRKVGSAEGRCINKL